MTPSLDTTKPVAIIALRTCAAADVIACSSTPAQEKRNSTPRRLALGCGPRGWGPSLACFLYRYLRCAVGGGAAARRLLGAAAARRCHCAGGPARRNRLQCRQGRRFGGRCAGSPAPPG